MSELRKPDGISQEWWENASEDDRNDVWNESIFYEGGNYIKEAENWTDGVGSTKLSGSNNSSDDDETIVWARPRVNKGKVGSTSNTIRYPSSYPITAGTDYVSMDFYQYQPPFGTRPGEDATEVNSDEENVTGQIYQNYHHSIGDNSLTERADGYKSILLFMPEDVSTQYGANWGGVGVGVGQAQVASMVGGKERRIGKMWSSTMEATVGGLVIDGYSVAKSMTNLTMGGNLTTDQMISGVSGRIINPNVELMYEAPELRGFNMNFKMMPRDPQEGRDIFGICQTLKKAMLPSWGGKIKNSKGGVGSLLTLPKIVSVKFMTGNNLNKYVTQYKPCAITNVSINYTPDGSYATYSDGSPVATLLSVQFKELKLVFEQEIPLPNSSNSAVATY